jgi:hypothetical protein
MWSKSWEFILFLVMVVKILVVTQGAFPAIENRRYLIRRKDEDFKRRGGRYPAVRKASVP